MTPRRFNPLTKGRPESSTSTNGVRTLRGVVFDMDGTLCEPQPYMFKEMRDFLGITKVVDILDHVESLSPEAQEDAQRGIRQIEHDAMAKQTAQPGLLELMTFLDTHHIPKAICTRNFDIPVRHLLDKFLSGSKFHPVVTRDFKPPKPDPAGILHIAEMWGLRDQDGRAQGEELLMVGDSVDDMTAGRRAGAVTVLLANQNNEHLRRHEDTDVVIESLDELVEKLENGLEVAQ